MKSEVVRLQSGWPVLGLGLLLAVLVYYPGLDGEFMFDDHWNILSNPALEVRDLSPAALAEAAGSGRAGPGGRPLAMLSFGLDHYRAGFDAAAFKRTNLLIHLLNGVLVFLLLRQLLRIAAPAGDGPPAGLAAGLVALLWLVHPLNLTSVLYVVQRMTLLASTFMLLGMIAYLRGRWQMRQGSGRALMLAAVLLCAPMASLGKEIGVLLPLCLLVLEAALFRFRAEPMQRRWLLAYHGLFALAPIALALVYIGLQPDYLLSGYAQREFGPWQRLLTESRVLWLYVQFALLPIPSSLGLFHDDIALSSGLLSPWTTAPAVLAWLLVLVALLRSRREDLRLPVAGLGLFLAGHALESTVFSLDIAYEHRNYLPQLGLLLALGWLLLYRLPSYRAGLSLVLLLALWMAGNTWLRAADWGSLVSFSVAEYRNHPASPRANYAVGRLYASAAERETDPGKAAAAFGEAEARFRSAGELAPGFNDGRFALLVLYGSRGLAPPADVVSALLQQLRGGPLAANTINQFESLFRCQAAGACKLPDALLAGLVEAATANPGASRELKRRAGQALADYRALRTPPAPLR